jgi:hypothetical protein
MPTPADAPTQTTMAGPHSNFKGSCDLKGWCKACGYALDAVPQPRCPECGQPFDPQDPTTYCAPNAPPHAPNWWWRNRDKLLAAACLITLAIIFRPRGLWHATFTATQTNGPQANQVIATVKVTRLEGPRWLKVQYPSWTTSQGAFTPGPNVRCNVQAGSMNVSGKYIGITGTQHTVLKDVPSVVIALKDISTATVQRSGYSIANYSTDPLLLHDPADEDPE